MNSIARQFRPVEESQGEILFNHLYKADLDGYVQIAHILNGKMKYKNFKKITLRDAIENYQSFEDIFITPNTTFNGKRLTCNIRQLRALFIDIDNREYSFNDIVGEVWMLANEDKIPYPTMVISSGRGCHLYWRIEHAPYQALATWQELEDYLYQQLKNLGADKQATDAVRLLRLSGTKNSKNGEECKVILIDENTTYSMYDLREKYLKWRPGKPGHVTTTRVIDNKQVNNTIIQFFTSYSLHIARAKDIATLCKLRNYNVIGYRNMILHCYAYWLGVTTRDKDTLEEEVKKLNSKFTMPLKDSEVKAILRCVPKAIDKFIEYEQGLRSGQIKRVSKGMRDKGGYWYKNETLKERLGIIQAEEKHLKTIISEHEKNARNAQGKRAKRRNENGLTKRQQGKQDRIKKVKELLEKGLGVKAIAKELKVAISTVSEIKNNKY